MQPDTFLPRFTYFFDISLSFLEEIAKCRAGRRIWSRITRERVPGSAPTAAGKPWSASTRTRFGEDAAARMPLAKPDVALMNVHRAAFAQWKAQRSQESVRKARDDNVFARVVGAAEAGSSPRYRRAGRGQVDADQCDGARDRRARPASRRGCGRSVEADHRRRGARRSRTHGRYRGRRIGVHALARLAWPPRRSCARDERVVDVLDAARFDVVIVDDHVGAGQSDVDIASFADTGIVVCPGRRAERRPH